MNRFIIILIVLLAIITILIKGWNNSEPEKVLYNKSDFELLKSYKIYGNSNSIYKISKKLDTAIVSAFCKSNGFGSYYIYIDSAKSIPNFNEVEIKDMNDVFSSNLVDYSYFYTKISGSYYSTQPY